MSHPLPWSVWEEEDFLGHTRWLKDATGEPLWLATNGSKWQKVVDTISIEHAIAERIVHACNNFERLRDAAKDLMRCLGEHDTATAQTIIQTGQNLLLAEQKVVSILAEIEKEEK